MVLTERDLFTILKDFFAKGFSNVDLSFCEVEMNFEFSEKNHKTSDYGVDARRNSTDNRVDIKRAVSESSMGR